MWRLIADTILNTKKIYIFINLCLVRNDASGYVMYIGDKGTTIEYNPDLEEWHMTSVVHPDVSATSNASFHTLSLGHHTWNVTNDDKCQKGEANLTLSLSSCSMSRTHPAYLWKDQDEYRNIFTNYHEEFICNDGLCVDLEKRCNGIVDCQVMTPLFTFRNIIFSSSPCWTLNTQIFFSYQKTNWAGLMLCVAVFFMVW